MGSLERLAKHMATSFKRENPTEVLSSVHDMLLEVAAALPKMRKVMTSSVCMCDVREPGMQLTFIESGWMDIQDLLIQ